MTLSHYVCLLLYINILNTQGESFVLIYSKKKKRSAISEWSPISYCLMAVVSAICQKWRVIGHVYRPTVRTLWNVNVDMNCCCAYRRVRGFLDLRLRCQRCVNVFSFFFSVCRFTRSGPSRVSRLRQRGHSIRYRRYFGSHYDVLKTCGTCNLDDEEEFGVSDLVSPFL